MIKNEFLIRLAEAIDCEGVIEADQDIDSIIEWDSLGILSVIELLSEMKVKVSPETLQKIDNISQLLTIVGDQIHE